MAYPTISCYPPLAQLSILPPDETQVHFSVLIEWSISRPLYPFEVFLCYSDASTKKHASQWAELQLKQSKIVPMVVRPNDSTSRRLTYTGTLPKISLNSQHIVFTLKYRVNAFAPWNWQEIQTGMQPGELLLSRLSDRPVDLVSLLKLEAGWEIESIPKKGKADCLFNVHTTAFIPRQSISNTELEVSVLGSVQDQIRFMALIRLEPYWIGPRHGKDYFYIGEDAVLCSFLTKTGLVVTFLAFNGNDDVYTVFRSDKTGQLVVASRNDGDTDTPFRILVAVASNFEDSMAAVMGEARKQVNQRPKIQDMARRSAKYNKQQDNNDWYDGLIYCTWNGIGQDLTTEKLLSALSKLSKHGIHISTLLIDDNWQTLGETNYEFADPFCRGWSEFEANEDISKDGIRGLIERIRRDHPGIREIGVWHALLGYWAGLAKEGKIAKEYKCIQVEAKLMGNIPATVQIADSADVYRLYDDFYTFLSSSGINFVKTDVQHMLAELVNTADRRHIPSAYQAAWTVACLRHFNGKAISCMSQTPQNIFHSLLQTCTPSILFRNSDDFYPEVSASHPWHIFVNAHNALLTQHLNVTPDWDMFQTSHPSSSYHAASRCVSGGPITITDVPGEHDLGLLDEMIAITPSGRSIALRPQVGKTTSVWDNYTDGAVLKVGTWTGQEGNETAILGLFNTSLRGIDFLFSINEFLSITSERIILRSHLTTQIFGPVTRSTSLRPDSLVQVSIPTGGYDILTAYPVHNISTGLKKISLAVIGLLGKMTGAAAIAAYDISSADGEARVKLNLKALGSLGLWISGTATVKGATLQGRLIHAANVKTSHVSESVSLCEVDILAFWRDSNMFGDSHETAVLEVVIA